MKSSAICIASPSLALVKYWGKQPDGVNIPATSSLAVSLGGLDTRTVCRVHEGGSDRVEIDGEVQPESRFAVFFENLRAFMCRTFEFSDTLYHTKDPAALRFEVTSSNNFPTAAGIASSSSGFAALAGACTAAVGLSSTEDELSALARVGSGSAARSVFGGFVGLSAGAMHARQLYPEQHWPELRVLIVIVRRERKPWTSRDAMESSRHSSPYYSAWVDSSEQEYERGLDALARRDIRKLGEAARRSYLQMFGTMLSADPPILYWTPESVEVIRAAAELRSHGIAAWETMDAGPQVKIITLSSDVEAVRKLVTEAVPGAEFLVASPGSGLRYEPAATT